MKTIIALITVCVLAGCGTTHKKSRAAGITDTVSSASFIWKWYSNKWEEVKIAERKLVVAQQNSQSSNKENGAKSQMEQVLECQQNLISLAAQYNDMRHAETVRAFTARGLPPQINIALNLTLTVPSPIPEKGTRLPERRTPKNLNSL